MSKTTLWLSNYLDLTWRGNPLSWDELVTQKWRDLVHKGLTAEQHNPLLKKYTPPEAIVFLNAPVLNPECKVVLKSNSMLKRDDHVFNNQDQAGRTLALGEGSQTFFDRISSLR